MMQHSVRVADGVSYLRTLFANVFFVESEDPTGGWVLVDTGVYGYSKAIVAAAERRFGPGAKPRAILLTHGHFDHVGNLEALLTRWPGVPVHAHPLEFPFLSGQRAYPPADPTVGGGMMAWSSRLYRHRPIDVRAALQPLASDVGVPSMPGWRWIHTPGHTPGHVSLFRDSDRVLLAGDAVVTTDQESLLAVARQRRQLQGPPAYFTPDWRGAEQSVHELAALRPVVLATGHGKPMAGAFVADALVVLARDFKEVAVPRHGRYVGRPAAVDAYGRAELPPDPLPRALARAAGVAAAGFAAWSLVRQQRRGRYYPIP